MKKQLQVLFLLLFCVVCSCEKQQRSKEFIEIDMVPVIEGEGKKMPLQEWAKIVRFIPLDNHANISSKLIRNVYLRNDTLLVHHLKSLSLFDKNGKHLYDIGYGSDNNINGKFVHLHNDLIYILDYQNKIKVYNWKGQFTKEFTLPSNVWDVLTIPGKDEMLAYVANQSGEEAVRFYRMRDGEVLDTVFNPFIYKLPEGVSQRIILEELLSSAGALRAFIEVGSDTVYRVYEDLQIRPYIAFNMGNHHYTRKQRYTETYDEWMGRMMEGNECYMKVTGEINDKVYFYNNREPSKIRKILYIGDTYCYDKATKEINKYFLTYEGNDWGISPDAFFEPRSLVEDKYLVDWELSGHGNNAVLVLVEP